MECRSTPLAQGDSCSVTTTLAATAEDEANGQILGGAYPSDGGRLSPALNLVYFRGEPPVFSVTGGAASENDGPLEFTVTLSESPSPQATVNYATSDGTALEGQDYTRTSDILTFAAGETSKTVRVPLLDDRLDEETFTLTLSEPHRGALKAARSSAVGTISDDDPLPWIIIMSDGAEKGAGENTDGLVRFRIAIVRGENDDTPIESGRTGSVDWTTEDIGDDELLPQGQGRATAGADYTPASGTVTFPADMTKGPWTAFLDVQILDDKLDEPYQESFRIVVPNPVNARISLSSGTDREGGGKETMTIVDDDERGVAVAPASLEVPEGGANTYAVALTSQPTEDEGATVSVLVPASSGLPVAPSTLLFTPDNATRI